MAERIVLDTGPILALACADALNPIGDLPIDFVAPIEVRDELEEGVRRGYPAAAATWLRFAKLTAAVSPLAIAELDRGEASVIQLALDQRIPIVGIDERRGRRAAAAVGLRVTGTLGLLGRAKVQGVVSVVRPYVDRMQMKGVWFDQELLARFLRQLGE
jgi:predicted nucleic acid-binding protein